MPTVHLMHSLSQVHVPMVHLKRSPAAGARVHGTSDEPPCPGTCPSQLPDVPGRPCSVSAASAPTRPADVAVINTVLSCVICQQRQLTRQLLIQY